MTLYWGAAASFAFFILVGLMAGKLFHLEGPAWVFLMGLMAALGVGSFAIFAYFQNRRQAKKDARSAETGSGQTSGGVAGPTEADAWIREANARLAQSRGGAGIANLPMIFVAGDRGTAKTSVILNSGLEPELLAGQVYQDNVVAPTRGANLFFARDTVFVEAGGTLMAQPSNWKSLVAKLQPGRLKGSNGLAPRGVVLCFDLEAFTRPGAGDAVANAARYLQERLGEVTQVLGISFPVYVLFTRADRLQFFADFVRNLTNEEAGQVVGVTLPIRSQTSGGVYAEEETRRLTAAFQQLFGSFCDQRLRLLPRESDYDKVPGAYEFPREFRKLQNILVQFLVDLGRPSQLRASPFLRGFYFSGVRPVEVRDIPGTPAFAPPPAQPELSGATGIFRAGMQAERRAQQAQAQSASGMRRMPQWLFLGHLFHDVILADGAGRAASGSSIRVSIWKRVLLAAAAGLFFLYSIFLIASFVGNRGLEDDAQTAARNIGAGEISAGALPGTDSLQKLEKLRQSLATLTRYKQTGAPLSLRWGLYSGDAMLEPVRRLYYMKFRQLLFGGTQAQMLAFLQGTPLIPGPSDDYGYAYDSLKAYLLTASEWQRSSDASLQAFLGSRLLSRWSGGHEAEIGPDRMALAKLQFDFYSQDLHNGNPYPAAANSPAVDHSRRYLSGFSGVERVYRFLLAEAAKGHPPATFNQQFQGSALTVTSNVEVNWAYTRDGWKFVQDQINKQNFGGEQWVLGPYQSQAVDPATMQKGVLDRYSADYVDQWRKVLRGSNVIGYRDLADASRKLTALTGSGAPLLALFWWTSQNTAVDVPGVADKFRAIQAVSPASPTPQYIVAQNQPYNQTLIALQQAVDRAANHDPTGDQQVRGSADSATAQTRGWSATFPPDSDGHIDQRAGELLLQPIRNLNGLGAEDLKSAGGSLCTSFNTLTTKFPFNSSLSAPDVSLDELGAILRPTTGRLWVVYNSTLKNVMDCPNGQCTAKPGANVHPNFVNSIGQLMRFSHALYGDAGVDPNLTFKLKPQMSPLVEEFTVTINGQSTALKDGAERAFTWPGAGAKSFRLTLKRIDGGKDDVEPYEGNWAVFRFFADANTASPSAGGTIFGWTETSGRANSPVRVNGQDLKYFFSVDTGGGPAVFSKDFLSRLKCVVPVTR